jgi:hypothetical protein
VSWARAAGAARAWGGKLVPGEPTPVEADRRRGARLLAERGIVTTRVTGRAIHTRPLEVTALIARTIAQREGALASARFEVGGDGKPM